ncbi:hypothetical protein EVAR_34549_1 [Eumeta japonica]|uniref:Uncharacterized protein n=1 Tax=Eumeta variegata TaxID=151549 RepID=A0A4C1X8I8_EUMVA|nr:hypothetical protein EVAR_34549_1 [Eumeta japonica]
MGHGRGPGGSPRSTTNWSVTLLGVTLVFKTALCFDTCRAIETLYNLQPFSPSCGQYLSGGTCACAYTRFHALLVQVILKISGDCSTVALKSPTAREIFTAH